MFNHRTSRGSRSDRSTSTLSDSDSQATYIPLASYDFALAVDPGDPTPHSDNKPSKRATNRMFDYNAFDLSDMQQLSQDLVSDTSQRHDSLSSVDKYSPRSSVTSASNVHEPSSRHGGSMSHATNDEFLANPHEKRHSRAEPLHSAANKIKDNYRGLHGNKRPSNSTSVPPLQSPIKPNFKKKGSILLGKIIGTTRKDLVSSDHLRELQELQESPQGMFSWYHSAPIHTSLSRHSSVSGGLGPNFLSLTSSNSKRSNTAGSQKPKITMYKSPSFIEDLNAALQKGKKFNLELNLNEMDGIVKSTTDTDDDSRADQYPEPFSQVSHSQSMLAPSALNRGLLGGIAGDHASFVSPTSQSRQSSQGPSIPGGWRAPDSWDVNALPPADTDLKARFLLVELESGHGSCTSDPTCPIHDHDEDESAMSLGDDALRIDESKHIVSRGSARRASKSSLPILFSSHRPYNRKMDSAMLKHNSIVRIFQSDGTFTTISCPMETTTSDMLQIILRKFFLNNVSNYQLVAYMGRSGKVLEPYEKPLKAQMDLLLLSGYTEKDDLYTIGREEMSFVCRFVVKVIHFRKLTHDEEVMLARNYVDVDISGLDLMNIPVLFHQHTYEIEKLNVSDNPAIYLPIDFIQACKNLKKLNFSRNGCSKFPINILEATQLTHLSLDINFIDEIPHGIGLLQSLTTLKLNSNQLSHLPKSFGKLKALKVLNLSSNFFETYPVAVNELTNLIDLDLSYNDLTELPDSIGQLINLSKLNLCSNILSPALPQCMSNLQNLRRLDVRYNELSNVEVLGTLPNLEMLCASKNNISKCSDQMLNLRVLHLDKNPITHLQLSETVLSLTLIDLSKAKLATISPEFISKVPGVERLLLDKNHLVNLPDEIGSLSKLVTLSIYGNTLQTLPNSIGRLASLQSLDLHSNNLRALPDLIWELRNLTLLNVSSNILSSFPKRAGSEILRISSGLSLKDTLGDKLMLAASHSVDNLWAPLKKEPEAEVVVPDDAGSLCESLLVLTLSDNRLSADCFDSISMLSSLKSLNLSYNDLLEIPEGSLLRLTRLNELYLSGNQLTNLPADDLKTLRLLKLLFVNNNKLVSLPIELSELTHLQQLDVGSNQLKYNICNRRYDWNWHSNANLRFLNFSGNKRFEIKQSHVQNPETGEDYDSLLVLKKLNVLGLIDVTLTTTSVPDQSADMRIRTAASELNSIGYGVAESIGQRECVSYRDIFIQKFRGNENEILVCSFDGKWGAKHQGHRISAVAKLLFVPLFTQELDKIRDESEINEAIRRTFLALNKEINGTLAAKKGQSIPSGQMLEELGELNLDHDANAGCSVTMLYLKDEKLYTANIGDIEAILSRSNGDHVLLTTKHDPTLRIEFERIRAAGGYVSGDGALDNSLTVSRGAGFFNFLPHTHSGPDIISMPLTAADDMIVVATRTFWDYISYELTVDIMRQEKDDPMLAAQKLRDYAICYGASDKMAIIVLTLEDVKSRQGKATSTSLYHNLGHENDHYTRRRERNALTGDSSLGRLEKEIDPPVGELALVFTDIKSSTLLWDTYPVAMRSAIRIHNSIMRRQLRIVGGYEVKTEGDAFMVSFPSPTSALIWCFNVQHNLLTADWPSEILESQHCCEVTDNNENTMFRGLSVRMGIHWGSPLCEPDVITGRMDYFGPMVNRASRISAVADGGQISVSSDFLDEINALYSIHENIKSKKTTVLEAYHGNVRAGEIIERELTSLEDVGGHYMPLGERKLKGLETPEPITLVYSTRLKYRFDLTTARVSEDRTGKIFETLNMDSLFELRGVSLRLEAFCSSIGMTKPLGDPSRQSSIRETADLLKLVQDRDTIELLNHVVTRIESAVTVLFLRQQMSLLRGTGGLIQLTNGMPILAVLLELAALVEKAQEVGDIKFES